MVDLSRVKVTQTLMIAGISSVRSHQFYPLTCIIMESTVSFSSEKKYKPVLDYSCERRKQYNACFSQGFEDDFVLVLISVSSL